MKTFALALVLLCLAGARPLAAQDRIETDRLCTYAAPTADEALYAFIPDQKTTTAVRDLLHRMRRPQGFILLAANVPRVAAVIEDDRRMLLYNPYFAERLELQRKDWAALAVLAHEVGHHVLGHALDQSARRAEDELEADRFSGHALRLLGAALEDAQAAADSLPDAAPPFPPRPKRRAAITEGWAGTQYAPSVPEPHPSAPEPHPSPPAPEPRPSPPAPEPSAPPPTDVPPFPWPPPQASAFTTLPLQQLMGDRQGTLQDVAALLERAFDEAGYGERSFFAVPAGFAMVSRLEQIDADGTPKQEPDRWSLHVQPMRGFSLGGYLKALFSATPGHYRIIAFVVTPHAFRQSQAEVSAGEARAWLAQGLNRLPHSIGRLPVTEAFTCTALIYEFERPTREHEAAFKASSDLTGRTHLEKARLWQGLAR